jgi:Methyltransferase domain
MFSKLTVKQLTRHSLIVANISDVFVSGYWPRDRHVLRAELRYPHRVRTRQFLLRFIPADSVGAELGVFTGLFSAILARNRRISKVTFVDPWWKAFGSHYPDWGAYTDYGKVSTRCAYEIAGARITRANLSNRIVEIGYSYDWLAAQPDKSLDWVYLDSTHHYEGTKRELELLDRKINDRGLILGDDWQIERNHIHHGVCLAVNEFLKISNFELILAGDRGQWVLRRALDNASAEYSLMLENFEKVNYGRQSSTYNNHQAERGGAP